MNILESVLSAGNGGVVKQLASQFGINADQAGSAVSALLPALAGGVKEKLTSEGGLALSKLVSDRKPKQFSDDPASLASPISTAAAG